MAGPELLKAVKCFRWRRRNKQSTMSAPRWWRHRRRDDVRPETEVVGRCVGWR